MHRFYLPPEQCSGPILELSEREAHHALHVLRLRPGDDVEVLDGAGVQLSCTVQELSKRRALLLTLEKMVVPRLPYEITLVQALPRGKIFDAIIQKSVELGVRRIAPLITERVVSHLDAEDAVTKTSRWRQVAIEAIKQCGSAWLPEILEPATPQQVLDRHERIDLPLFGALQSKARHPREYFESYRKEHGDQPRTVSVWVGPEGDLTADEKALLESAKILPITLGRLVLRVETAAIYCLSVLNYELESSDAGPPCATA